MRAEREDRKRGPGSWTGVHRDILILGKAGRPDRGRSCMASTDPSPYLHVFSRMGIQTAGELGWILSSASCDPCCLPVSCVIIDRWLCEDDDCSSWSHG